MKSEDEDDLSTGDDGSTTSYTTITSDTDDKGDTDHKRKSSPSKSFRLKDGSDDDDVLSLSSESAIPRRMNVRMRGSRGRPTRAAHRLKIRFQSNPRVRARGPGRPRGVRASRPRGRPPLRGRVFPSGDDVAGRSASATKNSASKRRFVSRAGRGGGRVGLSSGRVHRPDSDSDVKRETVDSGLSTPSTTTTTAVLPVADSAETSKKEAEDVGDDRLVCNGTGTVESATNGHTVATTTTSLESGDHEPSVETPPVDMRTFWRPPEEARPILDQVFITDVTANRVTVTVRESHTDTGFFRKREVEN